MAIVITRRLRKGVGCAALVLGLAAEVAARSDCDADGVSDAEEIQSGTSADCNGNGVPDECEIEGSVLLFQDHDGWPLPPGVTVQMFGLWHVGSVCSPPGQCGAGGFAYYGREPECDYDLGSTAGEYRLDGIDLPPASAITLEYCSFYEGEGGCDFDTFDNAILRLVDEGGVVHVLEWVSCGPSDVVWEQRQVDLTAFAGQTVHLRFYFSTRDEASNDWFGWAIDDVRITALPPGLDPDCDGDGLLDECEIGADPDLDYDANGVLDSCECLVTNYCATSPNSVGTGALMGWSGAPSLGAGTFELRAQSLPPGQFGLFFFGFAERTPPLPFGEGLRCVQSPIFRLWPVAQSSGAGTVARLVDFGSPPASLVDAGEAVFFQFWYRDPCSGCAGWNLTDGLRALFCP